MAKNFRTQYFRFKIRFGPFKIDSDQKKFFENFLIFWSFLPFLGPKNQFFKFFGGVIFKNFFTHFKRIVLWSFCAITCIPTPIELFRLTRFIEFFYQKWSKIEVFRKFWVEKNFFLKKIFVPSLGTCY